MSVDLHGVPVVQSSAAQRPIIQPEAQTPDQMQSRTGSRTEAGGRVIVFERNCRPWLCGCYSETRPHHLDPISIRVADVRRWKFPARIDIITANLFSELLIEILPKLKCAGWQILSGVLREQEHRLVCALKRNRIAVVETRRRGKWIAMLARGTGT